MKKKEEGRRVSRVENAVQQVVSRYLISHLQNEIHGLVTVSRVKMPADLRTAKVYVSVMGEGTDMAEVLVLLKERAPEIQNEISKKLEMRYCPKLTFFRDDSTEQVMKVDQLLKHLEDEKKRRTETDEGGDSDEWNDDSEQQ